MGEFHCPIGAVGYQSFGCIECGLCIARSKADTDLATERIRQYIKSTASLRPNRAIQKIAVCGKGGAGKSSVTAMLAFALVRYGFTPLVIDTDDSNAGLHRKLGIAEPPVPLIRCTERFSSGETLSAAWLKKDPMKFSDIPEQFIRRQDGIGFMMSGKIENPLQGCACTISDLTKLLVSNLVPDEKEIVLVDYDAGIESFGRGAEQGMDTIIAVVEPSFESVCLAETIRYLAEGLGIRRIRTIINKVADDEQDELVKDMLIERDVKFLGSLFTDRELSRANLSGVPLKNVPSLSVIERLTALMFDEAGMRYRRLSE